MLPVRGSKFPLTSAWSEEIPLTRSRSLTPDIIKAQKAASLLLLNCLSTFPDCFFSCPVSDNTKLLHTLPVFEVTLSDSSGRDTAECFGVNRVKVSLYNPTVWGPRVSRLGVVLSFSRCETNGMWPPTAADWMRSTFTFTFTAFKKKGRKKKTLTALQKSTRNRCHFSVARVASDVLLWSFNTDV